MICLITLDRFLVLRFPFSQVRFKPTSALVTCAFAWAVGICLAALPLTRVGSDWHFYSQTGICIPLPITRNQFKGHKYSFSVMIVLNFVLFLLIACGQAGIFYTVRSSSMKSSRGKQSSDLTLAYRLVNIVISDFLCWFPICVLGLMATYGIPIPGEVNVAMAIFVLPLNSALNPFLYTLTTLLEKQRKSREIKLTKRIEAKLRAEFHYTA